MWAVGSDSPFIYSQLSLSKPDTEPPFRRIINIIKYQFPIWGKDSFWIHNVCHI